MVLLDAPGGIAGWRKFLVSTWTFFECWLLTGLFYGWSSLVFVLKEEGIYGDLCEEGARKNESHSDNRNGTFGSNRERDVTECMVQDDRLALCFTVASFAYGGLSSAMGYVNYKTGTRITRLLAYVMNTAGMLCLAFVSKGVPWLMYPGLSLSAVAGLCLFVTNTQVAYIFTKYSSTYIGLLCGALDSSSAVFLFIKIAYQHGFPRRNMFFILTALHACTLFSTFLFFPKGFVTTKESQEIAKKDQELKHSDKEEAAHSETKPDSLLKILRQPLFITFCLWLALLQLRFYYFIGTLNVFLNRILDNDQTKVSYFTDVCFYTMMTGLVTAIGVGAFYDRLKIFFMQRGRSRLFRNVTPAIVPMACASLLSVLASVLILAQQEPLLYVVFIAITLKRSFLYSMLTAYVGAVFPSQFFGILFGIAMTTAAVVSCFHYAFFHWAESYDKGRFHADICLLFISAVTICHPVYMWVSAARAEKREDSCSDMSQQRGHSGKKYTMNSEQGNVNTDLDDQE